MYAASEILGKGRRRKKPWVTKDLKRDLKKKRSEAKGAKEYGEENRRIQKAMKKAKEVWTGAQCEDIETCLNKTDSKTAYQLVKDLAAENIAQNCTTIRVVETTQYLTAASPRKKICNQSSVRKLRLQWHH